MTSIIIEMGKLMNKLIEDWYSYPLETIECQEVQEEYFNRFRDDLYVLWEKGLIS